MAAAPTPGPASGGPAERMDVRAALDRLRAKVEAYERARYEPIALVGVGCRLPGGVRSAEAFWRLLANGVDAVGDMPPDRFGDPNGLDDPPGVPRRGGFVDGVAEFDPYYFGISPREAARIDPQQRLLLEVACDALDDGGQPREPLRGSRTGVFVGANSTDYLQLQLAERDIDTYTVVGAANSMIANRLSYLLDLRGPSLTVDTACSSSLVAVHLAVQSLRTGECDLALAAGVNLILSPAAAAAHAAGLPLAPDGRCKTFDASADGYARGEGVVVVVLKRLSDAVAAADRILAVISGSAVNQDGLTNGLTAPNGRAQQAVIRQALSAARLRPEQVSLLEAHGTGTVLGDPIEVEALTGTYDDVPEGAPPCALGSVKTNLGHLEAAAGLVGLVKVALSIHHRSIPTHLHLESLNPHLSLDGSRFFVPKALTAWDVPDDHRYGAVSSFGAGGTNAHVILGPAPLPPADPVPSTAAPDEAWLIPITAATADALAPMVRAYRDYLAAPGAPALCDIAHSAGSRRTQHEHRCVVVARSHRDAVERLDGWLAGVAPDGVASGRAASGMGHGVVFVFPGQGSQRAGMGRELMRTCPAFREAVAECDEAMRQWLGRSVVDDIHALSDGAPLEGIDTIQPALFALAVGLAARWRRYGVEPAAVVGHSMGEVAAAYVAGALTLADATRVICRRSTLLRRVSGAGSMLVVAAPMAEAERLVADHRDVVSIAVSNSPTSTVLSGDSATLSQLAEQLQRRNVFCRPVRVDVASHSPQMDPLRDDLMVELAGLTPARTRIPMLSTVTGALVDGPELDAAYWVRNLRDPVLFWPAVQRLIEQGHGAFVELSPHPLLLAAVQEGFDAAGVAGLALPSMRRDEPEGDAMLASVGALHANGFPVRLAAVGAGGRAVPLPGYAWQRIPLWYRDGAASPAPGAGAGPARVPAPATAVPAGAAPAAAPAADAAVGSAAVVPATKASAGTPKLVAALVAARPDDRVEVAAAAVTEAVVDVLRVDHSRVDRQTGFFQLGMDSMLAARVRVALESALGRRLPAAVMFEHPTVEALARHLVSVLAKAGVVDSAPPPNDPAGLSVARSGSSADAAAPFGGPVAALGGLAASPAAAAVPEELSESELLALLADEVRESSRQAGGTA